MIILKGLKRTIAEEPPEAARSLAIQGVDLLVNSTNWEKPYDYDIAKQMKHDYYTMLTERRPDVYIA